LRGRRGQTWEGPTLQITLEQTTKLLIKVRSEFEVWENRGCAVIPLLNYSGHCACAPTPSLQCNVQKTRFLSQILPFLRWCKFLIKEQTEVKMKEKNVQKYLNCVVLSYTLDLKTMRDIHNV